MLIDSHCHLDFPDYAGDIGEVMARAAEARVGLMLTISTTLSGFPKVREVAERYDNVYCTVGVHPHEAAKEPGEDTERLVALATHPKVVGIGETGLDFYYDNSPRDAQARSFRAHLDAAIATGLPVIVHTRDADAETAALLHEARERGPYRGLIHCFSSGKEFSEQSLALDLYISFSGIVTFKTADALRAIAREVPADRLLVETDAPFLAPVPFRGKRNEPAYVARTAALIAELRGESPEAFAAQTTENFFRLFAKIPSTQHVAS